MLEGNVGWAKNGLAGGAGAVAGPGRVPVLYRKAEVAERNAGELGKGFTIGKPARGMRRQMPRHDLGGGEGPPDSYRRNRPPSVSGLIWKESEETIISKMFCRHIVSISSTYGCIKYQ